MSNAIATNAATLLKLALRHRPTTFLIIEQPKGSFMFKMDVFRELFLQFSMFLVLTYLGLFGHDLLKASHLQSNMEKLRAHLNFWIFYVISSYFIFPLMTYDNDPLPSIACHPCPRTLASLARRATRPVKKKFDERIARKKLRAERAGKMSRSYYTTHLEIGANGQSKRRFSGGRDLQSSAAYPQRFCTAVYKAWEMAVAKAEKCREDRLMCLA